MLAEQAPTPQVVPEVTKSSSSEPSQSSSMPSQVVSSTAAPASGSQVSPAKTPAVQVSTPVLPEQIPTPHVVAWVSGSPRASSSIRPSQSSSMPLQASVPSGRPADRYRAAGPRRRRR